MASALWAVLHLLSRRLTKSPQTRQEPVGQKPVGASMGRLALSIERAAERALFLEPEWGVREAKRREQR
jgi:hypothetical protein